MKVIRLDDVSQIRSQKRLVTTNGTFDILHVGHLRVLQEAKKYGDVLLVLVNSDASVRLNKGAERPIVPEQERMEMLSGLSCVDYVLSFDGRDVLDILRKIKPDVHVKGGTFVAERIAEEKALVESWGGKHICLPNYMGYSTTNIIEKIQSGLVKNGA